MRFCELLAALVRLDAGAQQVLEDEQHDRGEADGADAEPPVAEGDAGGQQRRRELRRQRRSRRASGGSRGTGRREAALRDAATIAKLSGFVSMKTTSTTTAKPSGVAVPGVRSPSRASISSAADERERREDDDVVEPPCRQRRRETTASTSAGDAPIAAAGAGPSSAIASTIARNEPRDAEARATRRSARRCRPRGRTAASRTSSIGCQSGGSGRSDRDDRRATSRAICAARMSPLASCHDRSASVGISAPLGVNCGKRAALQDIHPASRGRTRVQRLRCRRVRGRRLNRWRCGRSAACWLRTRSTSSATAWASSRLPILVYDRTGDVAPHRGVLPRRRSSCPR